MCAANTNLRLRKWLEAHIVGGNKVKKQKNRTMVKWEIFEEFISYEMDDFWIAYWERAVKGKFPPGFFFNGKSLTYNHRNKTFITNLKDDSVSNHRLIKHMFQTQGHIYSPDDMQKIKNREFVNSEEKRTNLETTWASCSKFQQSSLLVQYARKIAKQMNFTREDRLRFEQTLRIGITTGRLSKDDVEMKNDVIVNIRNVEWCEDSNLFYVTIPYQSKPKKNNKKNVEMDYGEYPIWNKWIASVNNKKKSKEKIIEIGIDENNEEEFSNTTY
jgi:hypothetical protein